MIPAMEMLRASVFSNSITNALHRISRQRKMSQGTMGHHMASQGTMGRHMASQGTMGHHMASQGTTQRHNVGACVRHA